MSAQKGKCQMDPTASSVRQRAVVSMSSLSLLVTELQSLASETRRKYPEVREAAEKSIALLKSSPDVTISLASDGLHADDLLRPVFMGCATKNAKVIAIALGSLQRLITLRAISLSALPAVIQTINDCMTQGVDIQLKILQTLLSLITNFPAIHGRLLADALLLCFKLHESRTAVVSSTAAATLRQLVMFVVDKVVEEDRRLLHANELESIPLPDGTTQTLGPATRDAFAIFEDLCLLGNGERPQFLQLEYLHKTFALELIESVLTNYHDLFRKHSELLLLLRHHLSPLLLKTLSERSSFPLTLRGTRVVFLLLKQFSSELSTESEVFLMLLIKIVAGEVEGNEARPGWMKVLAMEIMRGLCSDAEFMRGVWQSYDASTGEVEAGGSGSARVFTLLISSLKRLVTSRPALLGVSTQMQGVGVPVNDTLPHSSSHSLDSVAGMVATAASATVSNVVGMMGTEAGLSVQSAAMKVQCIDQLDKADAPPIPDAYIYLLGVQCLVSLSDGLAGYAIPLYSSFAKPPAGSTDPVRAPGALDPSTLPSTEPARAGLLTVCAMLNAGWPALLAALSFLLNTNLSDALFGDVLGALQSLARAAGCLALPTPRDAFLTALAKAALPSRVVAALDDTPPTPSARSPVSLEGLTLGLAGGTGPPQPPGLSARNLACLRALVAAALFLAGTLGPSWFAVLEALQNADYVLTTRGTSTAIGPSHPVGATPSKRGAAQTDAQHQRPPSRQQPAHPLLADLDPESVQAAIQRLFDASKMLEDEAFHDFVGALCKLSVEMVGMQSGIGTVAIAEGPLEIDDDISSASASSTSLATPRADQFSRRRVSGIHIPRTLRSGDFGIARLGGVAMLNIQRLVYRPPEVAWNVITSHFLFILRNPVAPQPIRLQAARTLDDVLTIVPRHIATVPSDLQAAVQRRVLDVLAQQIVLDNSPPGYASSAGMDLRRMGLETLHQILQASGHTLLVGWETIFEVLGSVCRPAVTDPLPPLAPSSSGMGRGLPPPLGYLQEKGYSSLIKIAFQCMTLMCDTLAVLSPEHLRLCISTLGQFGRQADTNIALTAAESLFWGVSDAIQAKRREAAQEPAYSALWMHLLLEILGLCADARPEVRMGAIQTLFRTLQLYGATLSLETWDECVWKVTFPLLDTLSPYVQQNSLTPPPTPEPESITADSTSTKTTTVPDQSWDESKVVALQSIGAILNDFLISKIIHLPSFAEAWETFVTHIRDAFLLDSRAVSAPALRCLERALKAAAATATAPSDAEPLRKSLAEIWEKTWVKCDEMGAVIVRRAGAAVQQAPAQAPYAPFTQESLVAFVDVIKCVRGISKTLDGVEWPLSRIATLMTILKGVLTYPNSPDYRPDIDNLSPVQAIVMDAVGGIELVEAGTPSYILRDLSEYATLAFIASFDVPETARQETKLASTTSQPQKRITYIALAKICMPKLADLFLQFKDKDEIFVDEIVEAVLSAYAVPIKLKYECPRPSKFGKDQPLWKTATSCFLKIVKEVGPRIDALGSILSSARVESIWRQVIDVYRGGILSDCSAADAFSLSEQEEEENFDHYLITSLETDVVPCLGDDRVPDYLITQLAKILQQGSQLLQDGSGEEYPLTPTSATHPEIRSTTLNSNTENENVGSTMPLLAVSRERFSYWCLDLLFFICSDTTKDNEAPRRRIAALSLPALIGRCRTTLSGYVADERLRGNLPFPRVREEELLYVLHKLLELRLWPGSLWAALSTTPSKYATEQPPVDTSLPASEIIADSVRRSSRAHVFHFYALLCEIVSVPRKAPSAWVMAERLAPEGRSKDKKDDSPIAVRVHHPLGHVAMGAGNGSDTGRLVSLDARALARECLKEVGRELGVPR